VLTDGTLCRNQVGVLIHVNNSVDMN
jgi:hypothetical protein